MFAQIAKNTRSLRFIIRGNSGHLDGYFEIVIFWIISQNEINDLQARDHRISWIAKNCALNKIDWLLCGFADRNHSLEALEQELEDREGVIQLPYNLSFLASC